MGCVSKSTLHIVDAKLVRLFEFPVAVVECSLVYVLVLKAVENTARVMALRTSAKSSGSAQVPSITYGKIQWTVAESKKSMQLALDIAAAWSDTSTSSCGVLNVSRKAYSLL